MEKDKTDRHELRAREMFPEEKYYGSLWREAREKIAEALRKEREEVIEACIKIADQEFQEHTGFAGDYDAGAAKSSSNIEFEIRLLKENSK